MYEIQIQVYELHDSRVTKLKKNPALVKFSWALPRSLDSSLAAARPWLLTSCLGLRRNLSLLEAVACREKKVSNTPVLAADVLAQHC